MKTLSLTQPWASLVAIGAKTYETRSWSTSYRGQLAIHAAKRFPKWAKDLSHKDPFRSALVRGVERGGIALAHPHQAILHALPLGAIIATCNLVDVKRITATNAPDEPERSFGDYTPGRYMWLLEDVQPLETPVPAKGALSLWEWDNNGVLELPEPSPQARLF